MTYELNGRNPIEQKITKSNPFKMDKIPKIPKTIPKTIPKIIPKIPCNIPLKIPKREESINEPFDPIIDSDDDDDDEYNKQIEDPVSQCNILQ